MSILKRTVFYDNTGGVVRFWDWAEVLTTIGTMVEPFRVDARRSTQTATIQFDPTDEMCRIDEIRALDIDRSKLYLSGGEYALHNGCQIPRDGR